MISSMYRVVLKWTPKFCSNFAHFWSLLEGPSNWHWPLTVSYNGSGSQVNAWELWHPLNCLSFFLLLVFVSNCGVLVYCLMQVLRNIQHPVYFNILHQISKTRILNRTGIAVITSSSWAKTGMLLEVLSFYFKIS